MGVLEELVSELFDFTLPFLDDRVELWNLLSIVSLLVLAEKEKVGLVGRTPTVKEQSVLLDDALPQLIGQGT